MHQRLNAATELRAHGHSEGVAQVLGPFHAWAATLSRAEMDSSFRGQQIADALYLEGRHEEALALARNLAESYPEDLGVMGRLGRLAAEAGDTELAVPADAWLRDLDRPYLFGRAEYWRATIAAALGDRERAVTLLREALSHGLEQGIWVHRARSLEPLRGYAPFEELMRPGG